MTITVKFFASLREQLSASHIQIDANQVESVADVWMQATNQPMPEHVLCSVNLEHRDADDKVNDGDEVAFFPPITGG